MDPNTIIAIVAASCAGAAAIAAYVSLVPAHRAAKAAQSQTQLQIDAHRQALQPYVWADIRMDTKQGSILQLVVGNSGSSVATNVKVTVDPPLPSVAGTRFVDVAQSRLQEGLVSLAPGRILRWSLGPSAAFLKDVTDETAYTLSVVADGPFGPIAPLGVQVRPRDWNEVLDDPDGSLHLVRKELQKITEELRNARLQRGDGR